jgi:hypothetical protein
MTEQHLVQHEIQHVFFEIVRHFTLKLGKKVNDAIQNRISVH